jgi:1,4-dihydroxy-2-naphthoyl-CoA hydrolase
MAPRPLNFWEQEESFLRMDMSFTYHRTIHFKDTDAAGVVYFSNALNICHEAYESLLETLTIDLKSYFSGKTLAVPIVHAEIDFTRPMHCGDQIYVALSGTMQLESTFILKYEIFHNDLDSDKPIAVATTRHVAIDPLTRKRSALPSELLQWLAMK